MNQALSYLKDTWAELKLVSWPTRDQTLKLTVIVIFLSLFVGLYVGSLDYIFTALLKVLLHS